MHKPSPMARPVILVAACLVAAFSPGWLFPVDAAFSPLSTDAVLTPGAESQIVATSDPAVVRSRAVAINVNTFPNPRTRPQLVREPALSLELFPDVSIVAVFDRFDPNTSGVTWVGHVDGVVGSSVTFVYENGLLAGSIVMPSGTYRILPASEAMRAANPQAAGEVHIVAQVDQAALPREAEPLKVNRAARGLTPASDRPMVDSPGTIDVMVVYTALAQQHAGGPAAMANLINIGISETNTTYVNSDVKQRVRLVHSAQVGYLEVSVFETNIVNLQSGDGALAGVAALRDQFKADLVMMLIHPAGANACGIAYVMDYVSQDFEPYGYSVTDTACVTPGLTVAHEWGHNMGANHDWFVNTDTQPHTYAHGYANTKAGQRWRTVMSYNDACIAQGFSCTRLLAWANPELRMHPFCAGGTFACRGTLWFLPFEPMGIPGGTRSDCAVRVSTTRECDADDHRTLNETALTVANFRQSVPSTTSGRR